MIFLRFILIANIALTPLAAEEATVLAERGLALREKPDQNAKMLILIPFRATVTHLVPDVLRQIDGYNANWYKVKYLGKEGFAYGAYLGYPQSVYSRHLAILKSKGTLETLRTLQIPFVLNMAHGSGYLCLLYAGVGEFRVNDGTHLGFCEYKAASDTANGATFVVRRAECVEQVQHEGAFLPACTKYRDSLYSCTVSAVLTQDILRGRRIHFDAPCTFRSAKICDAGFKLCENE